MKRCLNIKIECTGYDCINDIRFSPKVDWKFNISGRRVMNEINKNGWYFGREVLCPECLEKRKKEIAICRNCKNFRDKTMEYTQCQLDFEFCDEYDTCKEFESEVIK